MEPWFERLRPTILAGELFSVYSDISDHTSYGFVSLFVMDYFAKRRQLGQRIADVRKAQNITQRQLALMSDINKGYLSEIENGISNVSVNKLFRIAEALGVSALFDEGAPESE